MIAVLISDRHTDVEVKVFSDLAAPGALFRALECAQAEALNLARGDAGQVQVYLTQPMERAGWIWYASVGPEGDSVRVQKVEMQ
jgi:hypothetical protein